MMTANRTVKGILSASLALAALGIAGCPQSIGVPVHVELAAELSDFELLSGEVGRNQGVIQLGEVPLTAASGTFALDGDHLSVSPTAAPTGPGKGSVNLHSGRTIQVTVRLGEAADVDSVCDTGESYGPFTVDFDSFDEFESITPAEVTLSSATIDLISAGTMSVCIECVPEFSGTVQIGGFTFRVAP